MKRSINEHLILVLRRAISGQTIEHEFDSGGDTALVYMSALYCPTVPSCPLISRYNFVTNDQLAQQLVYFKFLPRAADRELA